MKQTILVIDDDQKLNSLLTSYLAKFDYKVIAVTNPDDGFRVLKLEQIDLIILDVMLPGMDGFEACRRIRSDYSTPIIMLTARGEVTDRIVGLELGADDYMPKPFEPRELVARIQTVLRRGTETSKSTIRQFGKLTVDFHKRSALINNIDAGLTSAEFTLLSLFISKSGKTLTRDQLLDQLKGIEWESFDRSVDVLISRLRHKLDDNPKNPGFIKTVRGSGYIFIGEESSDQ